MQSPHTATPPASSSTTTTTTAAAAATTTSSSKSRLSSTSSSSSPPPSATSPTLGARSSPVRSDAPSDKEFLQASPPRWAVKVEEVVVEAERIANERVAASSSSSPPPSSSSSAQPGAASLSSASSTRTSSSSLYSSSSTSSKAAAAAKSQKGKKAGSATRTTTSTTTGTTTTTAPHVVNLFGHPLRPATVVVCFDGLVAVVHTGEAAAPASSSPPAHFSFAGLAAKVSSAVGALTHSHSSSSSSTTSASAPSTSSPSSPSPPGVAMVQSAFHTHAFGEHMALSPDGRLLAGVQGRNVVLWDVETGEMVRTLRGHSSAPVRLCFVPGEAAPHPASSPSFAPSPSASPTTTPTTTTASATAPALPYRLASATNRIRLWDLASGRCVQKLVGHGSAPPILPRGKVRVQGLAATPDGRLLLSCVYPTLLVWDLQSGVCIHRFFSKGSAQLCLAPDGVRVLGVHGGKVYVNELQTGRLLMRIRAPGHLNISAMCVRAVGGGADGRGDGAALEGERKGGGADEGAQSATPTPTTPAAGPVAAHVVFGVWGTALGRGDSMHPVYAAELGSGRVLGALAGHHMDVVRCVTVLGGGWGTVHGRIRWLAQDVVIEWQRRVG